MNVFPRNGAFANVTVLSLPVKEINCSAKYCSKTTWTGEKMVAINLLSDRNEKEGIQLEEEIKKLLK
jgi:hypothetical protein